MTGKKWLAAVGVGVLLAGSGCVTCCHKAAKTTLEVGPACDVPLCDRQHVYVVMVNGATPAMPCGLEGLRDKLAEAGFAKVYCGQLYHALWFEWEMARVHECDPAARFVLVGYDFGGPVAAGMARAALAKGIPVDAVFLLDPVGKVQMGGCATRTILVRSGACPEASPHTESVAAAGANHFTLPTHPQTVASVCGVLKEVAVRVEHAEGYTTEYGYDHAAPPRAVSPPAGEVAPEWLFLYEKPGTHGVPLAPTTPGGWPVPIAPSMVPRGGFAPPVDLPRARPLPYFIPLPPPPPATPLPTPKKLGDAP